MKHVVAVVLVVAIATIVGCYAKSITDCSDLQVQVVAKDVRFAKSSRTGEQQAIYYQKDNEGIQMLMLVDNSSSFTVIFSGPDEIEWSYDGPGVTSLVPSKEMSTSGCYVIRLSKPKGVALNPSNTGRYTAQYVKRPADRGVSVYIFAASKYPPFLMNAGRFHTVEYKAEGGPLFLPCFLNDPTAKVSFSKRVGLNEWRQVSDTEEQYDYNPQHGFKITKPLFGSATLYGSYKCFTQLHNRNDTVFINVSPYDY